MIYFDNAATSYPKPPCVYQEMENALINYGGNPGRGSYPLAHKAAKYLYESRSIISRFLGAAKPAQIIFTLNATEAANTVLRGYLRKGEEVVYFSTEHNANFRPLKALELKGIKLTKVKVWDDDEKTISGLLRALTPKTRLIVACYGSNVSGKILPLAKIIEAAHCYGAAVYSDMAQTAGFLPLELTALGVDFAAFAGHKSLLGPPGTGLLYVKDEGLLEPLKTGGTGSNSQSPYQPKNYPDALESGSLNLPGIGGLAAGINYLQEYGEEKVFKHEAGLTREFMKNLKFLKNVEVYGPEAEELRLPVVSLNVRGKTPEEVSEILYREGEIAVRAGLHCAPEAHRTLGTFPTGTVRFSFGLFNTMSQVNTALDVLSAIR
ncbi:MAG: aminotransferase class V-fold PLP-dependent enzyme [Bacillota bacterium]|nr:aminotransferase class V-fold PLP-dependent enzyme [Bacillota bacterium]